MPWPMSQDYNEAIQNPTTCFSDSELRQAAARCNAIGLPMPRSGNFADVYELVHPSGPRWAVKCFTRQVPGLRERYAAISAYLRQAKLPFMVDFNYLEQGVQVKGQWYPILKMDWVEGFGLNQFIGQNADNPALLQATADLWLKLARRLHEAGMAHCDLQHGNVLLVPGKRDGALSVRLIDYDGMWVPALAGQKSGEVGHPAFQHPQRLRDGTYNGEVDRFPHLVIYTALRGLILGSRYLWNKYDNGDNLLFRQADLAAPAQSPLVRELVQRDDPQLRRLVDQLSRSVDKPLEETPLLDELVSSARTSVRSRGVGGDSGQKRRRGSRWQVLAGALLVLALLGLAVGGVNHFLPLLKKDAKGVVAVVPSSARATPNDAEPPHPAPKPQEREPKPKEPDPKPKEPEPKPKEPEPKPKEPEPKSKEPEPKPKESDPKPKEPEPKPKDPEPKPKEPAPKPKEPAPEAVPVADKRAPVPDAAAQAKAERLIKDLYKSDYAKLKKAADRTALADKLIQAASETKNDLTARFVLLREARDLGAQAGDLGPALKAVDQLAETHAIDSPAMKLAALSRAYKTATTAALNHTLTDACLTVLDEAIAADNYDVALRLLPIGEGASQKTGVTALVTRTQARGREVRVAQKEYELAKAAVDTLKQKPDDGEANLIQGKYLCRRKGDWKQGLPLLAKGADAALGELARKDLAMPADPAEQAAVGDGWWDFAAKEQGAAKAHFLRRASFWYQRAAPGLTGLTKVKVEKRLADTESTLAGTTIVTGSRPPPKPGSKIRVVLIDGQNNHNWRETSPLLKKVLGDSGRFTVNVATAPEKPTQQVADAAYRGAMSKFRVDLNKYDVVLSNYNGEPWPKEVNDALDAALKSGKVGLVIVHAANNAFGGWNEYNQMIGMGWRGNKGGDRLMLDDSGKEIRVPSGQGDGSGHRYVGVFQVTVRNQQHPITKGMPKEWMHDRDELYDNMRGPIQNVHLLATAYSKGTKAHEPTIWTVDYGKGRVFHTPMGHDGNAMRCIGFVTTLLRGTEWAATGQVTIPIPRNFPTAAKTSALPK